MYMCLCVCMSVWMCVCVSVRGELHFGLLPTRALCYSTAAIVDLFANWFSPARFLSPFQPAPYSHSSPPPCHPLLVVTAVILVVAGRCCAFI